VAELVDLPTVRQARWTQNTMFKVYAIKSLVKNYIYVGMTQNLDERIKRHNSGCEVTTKPYSPFQLIYTEEFQTRIEARKKEKYFKSAAGRRWIKKNLF